MNQIIIEMHVCVCVMKRNGIKNKEKKFQWFQGDSGRKRIANVLRELARNWSKKLVKMK